MKTQTISRYWLTYRLCEHLVQYLESKGYRAKIERPDNSVLIIGRLLTKKDTIEISGYLDCMLDFVSVLKEV